MGKFYFDYLSDWPVPLWYLNCPYTVTTLIPILNFWLVFNSKRHVRSMCLIKTPNHHFSHSIRDSQAISDSFYLKHSKYQIETHSWNRTRSTPIPFFLTRKPISFHQRIITNTNTTNTTPKQTVQINKQNQRKTSNNRLQEKPVKRPQHQPTPVVSPTKPFQFRNRNSFMKSNPIPLMKSKNIHEIETHSKASFLENGWTLISWRQKASFFPSSPSRHKLARNEKENFNRKQKKV